MTFILGPKGLLCVVVGMGWGGNSLTRKQIEMSKKFPRIILRASTQ